MKNDVARDFVKSRSNPDDLGVVGFSDAEVTQPNTAAKQKKPYEKPAFRHEKVLVTTTPSYNRLSGTTNSKGP